MNTKKNIAKTEVNNFYDMEYLNDSVDNDLISSAEGGFMQGYIDY